MDLYEQKPPPRNEAIINGTLNASGELERFVLGRELDHLDSVSSAK